MSELKSSCWEGSRKSNSESCLHYQGDEESRFRDMTHSCHKSGGHHGSWFPRLSHTSAVRPFNRPSLKQPTGVMGNSPVWLECSDPLKAYRIHTELHGNTHLRIQQSLFTSRFWSFFLVNEENMKLDEKVRNRVLQELVHTELQCLMQSARKF